MPKEIIMPALGMSQDTGRLLAWLKNEGDAVAKGEAIMEVETDKTTVEVDAPASGTLANVTAHAGDDVPVGQVIALILAEGESAPALDAPAPATTDEPTKSDNGTSRSGSHQPGQAAAPARPATPVASRVAAAHDINLASVPSDGKRITRADVEAYLADGTAPPRDGDSRVLASPKARRLAREHGVELVAVAGSGPQGAVIAADVLNYQPPTAEPVPTRESVAASAAAPVQTGTMWRRMAERLTDSWQTVPHFYLKRVVSANAMIDWRKRVLTRSEVKITYTDLLVKLVAAALRQHPHVNGSWSGEGVVFNERVNVGLAVAVDQGLLVPVIHDADTLGLTEIAQQRKAIVTRAQDGKLKPDDLQGGTFTISNLGMFGIDEFEAIVNPPQAAILAVGRIIEQVQPVDGAVEIVPTMALNLSCDHRAVDGARGAQFMDTLANLMADPLRLID